MEQLLINTAFCLAFIFLGYKIGRIYGIRDVDGLVVQTIDATLTGLIRDGYIQTVGKDDEEIILKWWEEYDSKDEDEK